MAEGLPAHAACALPPNRGGARRTYTKNLLAELISDRKRGATMCASLQQSTDMTMCGSPHKHIVVGTRSIFQSRSFNRSVPRAAE
jgi:hypothetical protein